MTSTLELKSPSSRLFSPHSALNVNIYNGEACEVGGGNGICYLRANDVLRAMHPSVPPAWGVTFMGDNNPAKLQEAANEFEGRLRLVKVPGEVRTDTTVITGDVERLYPGKSTLSISHGDVDTYVAQADNVRSGEPCLLTGSLPPGLPESRHLYLELASRVSMHHGDLGFDLRPAQFWELLKKGFIPKFWKANLEEFEKIVGKNLQSSSVNEICRLARHLLPDAYVIISLGRHGLIATCPDGRAFHVSAQLPSGEFRKSAVGAGDFTWCVFIELLKIMDFEEAIYDATAAGVAGLANLISGYASVDLIKTVRQHVVSNALAA